jgi:hypothetical protein
MAKAKGKTIKLTDEAQASLLPELVGQAFAANGYTRVGRNASYNDGVKITLNNIGEYDLPYGVINESYITARDIFQLCQKAYTRFPVFKTAVDTLTDLANTKVHLKGGNAQSRRFFEALFKKIHLWKLQEQIFTECFLTGTMILYRTDATISGSDVLKMSQLYANKKIKAATEDVQIPSRYILLDPSNICVTGLAYNQPTYYKILSKFELEQLKRSNDKGDKETHESIKNAITKYAGHGGNTEPIIELDPDKLTAFFYRKQDYQPFPVPMGYCVLEDINLKLEFRKMDAILARTVELSILLVTLGDENNGANPLAMNAVKNTFRNDKVGRVLVGDHTLKAQFVSPDIADLMGPAKYDDVNASIANGLMNIFFGENKFADSVNKLRALAKKIENAQNLFLNEFLNPEIKRISKILNFKAYPTAEMEPVRLEDQTNALRVYAQLLQMGVLTPKDGLELIDTGIMPDYDSIEVNQEEFKTRKDKGLFQPIQGGPHDQREIQKMANDTKVQMAKNKPAGQSGRPSGTKSPQTTKRVSQVGASLSSVAIAANTVKMYNLKEEFQSAYKKAFNIKRLNKNHNEIIETQARILAKNEQPNDWLSKIPDYLTIPADKLTLNNIDTELATIEAEFEVDYETAIVLYHSQIK